jgi:hypothetical protein
MKGIYCPDCHDVFILSTHNTRYCYCLLVAGKYLKDNVTAVVSKKSMVFGIDNNTFNTVILRVEDWLERYPDSDRMDFYFTGWMPTKPGEVIYVDTVNDVSIYIDDRIINTESTLPNTSE